MFNMEVIMKTYAKKGVVPANIPRKPNTNTGYVPPGIPKPAPKPPSNPNKNKK